MAIEVDGAEIRDAARSVARAIRRGELDDQLEPLKDAVIYRMEAKRIEQRRRIMAKAEVGRRVVLGAYGKPKYLHSQTGEIEAIRQSKLVIKLDCGPIGKFRSGRVICPASAIEFLEEG